MKDYLGPMRQPYERGRLDEADLAPTWLEQLRRWLEDAVESGLPEPNAMVLATSTTDGRPSVRTVLLKGLDERGLAFFTNLHSRKGRELSENPRAAVLFPWSPIERQVAVQGRVEAMSAQESDEYFDSRPVGARLSALASRQSQVIASRAELEDRFGQLANLHGDAGPPRPDWWGGLRVVPDSVELWQGRPDRLHDRLQFRQTDAGWVVERLAP